MHSELEEDAGALVCVRVRGTYRLEPEPLCSESADWGGGAWCERARSECPPTSVSCPERTGGGQKTHRYARCHLAPSSLGLTLVSVISAGTTGRLHSLEGLGAFPRQAAVSR